MRIPVASALLLLFAASANAGVMIGNSGNGLRPTANREGLIIIIGNGGNVVRPAESSAGSIIIIGNSGNGLRPTADHASSVRLPVRAVRWQFHARPGPTLPAPQALQAPADAIGLDLVLEGDIEVRTPAGGWLRIDADQQTLAVPLADPGGDAPLAGDLVLPDWLETATDQQGTLVIGVDHPWHGAALRAIEDGLLVW